TNYLQSGEYVKAIDTFSYLINISPEHDYLIYLLGLSYYLNKDIDDAILTFDKALKIKPNNDDYLFNLAHCYINKKDFVKAIEILRKCIEISPSNLEYYKDLGIILQEVKQYNEALKIYEFLLKESHDDEIYNNYGLIHLQKDDYQLARNCFSKAIEINSSKSKYYANISLSFIQEYEYFYKDIKINSYDEYESLSKYYHNLLKEALKFILKALEINNNDSDYHNYYGMVLLRSGKYDESIKEFNIAINFNSNNSYYYSNLASSYE
ncbi:MAG: tetratricopeptide repeat protein, partial [Candidatus Sericytochromatia bacterium]